MVFSQNHIYIRASYSGSTSDHKEVQTEYIKHNWFDLSLLSSSLNRCPIWYTFATKECYCIALSPDARLIATGGQSCVMIWSTKTGALVRESLFQPGGSFKNVLFICFSSNNKFLAAMTLEHNSTIWSLETGAKLFEVNSTQKQMWAFTPNTAAFTEDSEKFVVQSEQSFVNVYCMKEYKCIVQNNMQVHGIIVRFSPDGNLVLCNKIRDINICSTSDGSLLNKITLVEIFTPSYKFIFSCNSKKLVCVCIKADLAKLDLSFQSWDLSDLENIKVVKPKSNIPNFHSFVTSATYFPPPYNIQASGVSYSADKDIIVIGYGSWLLLVDIQTRKCFGRVLIHASIQTTLCMSDDETFIAMISQRRQLLGLWNFQKLIRSFPSRILDSFEKKMQCHYYI